MPKKDASPPLKGNNTPLLLPLLSYIIGLLTLDLLPSVLQQLSWIYAAILAGIGIIYCAKRGRSCSLAYISCSWVLIGISFAQAPLKAPSLTLASPATHSYRAYLLQAPKRASQGRHYILQLKADLRYTNKGEFAPLEERIRLLYHSTPCPFQVGDELWVRKPPKRLQTASPGTWYHRYVRSQEKKGIYFEDHASRKDLIPTGRTRGHFLWITAQKVKTFLKKGLQSHLSSTHSSLAIGLLLGDRNGLKPSLQQSFSSTGSMHILAVSGLHAGILFGIFLLLGNFLPWRRHIYTNRLIFALIGLWSFAFVVGFSASVLRASILCTILAIGTWIGRRGHAFNSLCCAALCILLISPEALFALGFQLSFLAVLGILLLYEPLFSLISPTRRVPRLIWGSVCISLSAQVAVFPLLMYHFQLVSLISPLTNIILMPLLSIILPLSLAVAVLSGLTGLAGLLALILEPILGFMTWWVEALGRLPLSHLYPLPCTLAQVWLLYVILVASVCIWLRKRIFYAWIVIPALLSYGAIEWQRRHDALTHDQLWLNVDKHGALLLQYTQNGTIHQSASATKSVPAQRFLQQKGYSHALLRLPLEQKRLTPIIDRLLYSANIGSARLLWLKGPAHKVPAHLFPLKADYLVLSKQTKKDIDVLCAHFQFKEAILKGRKKFLKQWASCCACTPHLLNKKGAFHTYLDSPAP